MTTIQPKGGHRGASYDAFEYISHSHTYISDNQPTAKFTYDLSPIQVSPEAVPSCPARCPWVLAGGMTVHQGG